MRKTYVCSRCEKRSGYQYIARRAFIVWNDDAQDWLLADTWATMFCPQCDADRKKYTIREVNLEK